MSMIPNVSAEALALMATLAEQEGQTTELGHIEDNTFDAEIHLEEINDNAGALIDPASAVDVDATMSAKLRAILIKQAAILATMPVDPNNGYPIGIDAGHNKIHAGLAFKVHYSNITTNSDDHRSAIAFATPAGLTKGHFTVTVSASNAAEFFLEEAPTSTTPQIGIDQAFLNRNRGSANESIMSSLEVAPTVANASVYDEAAMATAAFVSTLELDHTFLRAGDGPQAIGGTSRDTQEFILKASTVYLMYIQNIGASINTHSIQVEIYENTNPA